MAFAQYITTTVLGVIVVLIAFFQWKTENNRFRLDLYNKRFDVYIKTLDLYQAVMKKTIDEAEASAIPFIRYFRESLFLFCQEDGIYETLEKIKDVNSTIIGSMKEPGNPQLLEAAAQARDGFEKLIYRLEKQLDKYLNLRNLK